MPRATRLIPIAMPTGIAVTQASAKAEKTRNRLAAKCCQSGLSLACPVRYSWNCWKTACGLGRKSGLTQPMFVTRSQSANSTVTVTTLMRTLEPSPGTLNRLVFSLAFASGMHRVALVDDRQHLLADSDELGLRLDLACIAVLEVLARERHVLVGMRDAAGARAHDDQARRQEQRLLDRMRDEEDHLVRRRPGPQQDLLHLLAGEGVECAHG